jgi:hypothetical protein
LARALGPALLALALLIGGCGDGGAAAGATVSVYVAAPLCGEAREELAKAGGKAADLEVRVDCLSESAGESTLAEAGAGARSATEDSTSVAYVEAPGPAAEFSRSIVDAAGIAWLQTSSGSTALRRILSALEGSDSSPRQAVLDEVG